MTSVSRARSACALVESVAAVFASTVTVPGAVTRNVRPPAPFVIDPPAALRYTSRCEATVPSMNRFEAEAVSVTSVAAPTVAIPPVTRRSGAVKAIEPFTVVAPSTARLASEV